MESGSFKVPKGRVVTVAASLGEDDSELTSSGIDDENDDTPNSVRSNSNRRYRGLASTGPSHSGSIIAYIILC